MNTCQWPKTKNGIPCRLMNQRGKKGCYHHSDKWKVFLMDKKKCDKVVSKTKRRSKVYETQYARCMDRLKRVEKTKSSRAMDLQMADDRYQKLVFEFNRVKSDARQVLNILGAEKSKLTKALQEAETEVKTCKQKLYSQTNKTF